MTPAEFGELVKNAPDRPEVPVLQKERLLALANWLEGGAQHKLQIRGREVVFDMAMGIQVLAEVGADFDPNTCKTACCIAGAAVEFFAPGRADAFLRDIKDDLDGFGEVVDGDEDLQAKWEIGTQAQFYTNTFGPGVADVARELLGLTYEQSKALFVPNFQNSLAHCGLRDFNDPLQAARVIRHGVATGEFNWDEEAWEKSE